MPFALAPLAFPSLLLAAAGMTVDLPAPPAPDETLRLDAPPPAPSRDDATRSMRLPRAGL
jgi:hypothetical protein